MEIYLVRNFWAFLLFQHWGRSGYGERLLIFADASAKCDLSLWFIHQFLLQSHCATDDYIILPLKAVQDSSGRTFPWKLTGKVLTYSFVLVYASVCHSSPDYKWEMRLELSQNLQYSVISLLFAAWIWALQATYLVVSLAQTPGSVWGLCTPRGHPSAAAGFAIPPELLEQVSSSSSFCLHVFCSKSWAQLAPSTSSDAPHHPPAAQMANQALIHKSACRRDLCCCCLPFPTQAAVPGFRLTGEPKGRRISTVVLCAKIWPCLSVCQHLHSDLSIAGTSRGPKVAPWTGGLNVTQLVSPRVVVRLLFACLLRANIRRGWKGNF